MSDNTEARQEVSGKYLRYMDQPLVREGNTICYGDMSDKCFLILEIMSYKTENGRELPDKIFIQVVESANPSKIIKQGEKSGLSAALIMGMIWLERDNNNT